MEPRWALLRRLERVPVYELEVTGLEGLVKGLEAFSLITAEAVSEAGCEVKGLEGLRALRLFTTSRD